MNDLIVNYTTRNGRNLTIKLPLNEYGEVLAERYLNDSERRRLLALRIRADSGEDRVSVTMH